MKAPESLIKVVYPELEIALVEDMEVGIVCGMYLSARGQFS
jgi:hypothetical protein